MGNNILTAVFLLSVCSGGLSEQSSAYRTVALEGQTAVLPCTFTFTSIERLTIEWTKNEKDLSPNYVFTLRSGHEDYDMKNPKFQHRTHLFMDKLKNGNASLRISDVSLSDAGKYKCKIIQDSGLKEREVELFVGGLPEQSPAYRTVALEGQTALLPCTFTFTSIERLTIEWTKDDKDLSPNIVFLLNSGHEEDDIKNQLFWHRTHLFMDELSNGNASLRISDVRLSDAGKYKCKTFQDSGQNEREVELFVGLASEPKFQVSIEAEGVSLQCEASCWFPEPKMTFLDEQGKVINTEKSTMERRGGTGCFTVTGRITVQSAGRFICRVHQFDMNLTRDAEIYVQTQSRAEHVTSILVVMVILLLVVVIICIVFRRKLSKLFKCVRRQKSLQPHSGQVIERHKYENSASTCEDDNIEHSNCEQTKGLNGPDQNQTSVSLSRSVPLLSNSFDGPLYQPVQENCSRPEPLNVLLSPKSTDSLDLKKTEFTHPFRKYKSAPAQLFSTSVKLRTRLKSHVSTPEITPLMEDCED